MSAACAACAVVAALTVVTGCSDGETGSSMSSSGSPGSTSVASSGAGGAGGESGSGGAGGSGGGASACLDPSAYAGLFTIDAEDLCAVAIYTADVALDPYASATWGSHEGPLTVSLGASGSVDLTRWQVPAASSGKLTPQVTNVKTAIPEGSYLGAQAIDLPFFGWTSVSWGGAFPSTEGEVILLKGTAVDARYDVQSFFSGAGTVAASGQGRLLYTGLSPVGDPALAANGLYAADSCGTEAKDARLLPDGDPSCGSPALIAAWGESSGPVTADSDGNVFAIMTSFTSGDQEARGFEASAIARGASPTDGSSMFKLPGFGMSLAALAPVSESGDAGLLAFQPNDPSSSAALDVVGQRYSVSGKVVMPLGAPKALFKLAKPGTSLALVSDGQGRLWVGGAEEPGNGGGARFVVVARAKP